MAITLAGYKSYSDINTPNQDDKLTPLIAYANDFAAKYCGTKFEPTTETGVRILISEGGFILPNAPVISVENLTLNDDDRVFEYWVNLEEGTAEVDFEESLYATLDYTWGYPSVPPSVEVALYELVTYYAKREYSKSKTLGGETITYLDPAVIPVHVRAGLDLYKVI